jgi:hypothetical protein
MYTEASSVRSNEQLFTTMALLRRTGGMEPRTRAVGLRVIASPAHCTMGECDGLGRENPAVLSGPIDPLFEHCL